MHVAKTFDSNIFIQESRKGWPERGWHGEHPLVILSEAKDLTRGARCFVTLSMTVVHSATPDMDYNIWQRHFQRPRRRD